MDARIRERRRQVREQHRLLRRRRTLTVAGILIVVAVLAGIERSPLVAVEQVEVTGVQRLEPAVVLGAADVPLGTSTVRLQLHEIEARVEALPLVRRAEARRADPLTVHIAVVEREPALEVRGVDRTVLVDREGVVIEDGALGGLPVVVLVEPAPQVGARVTTVPSLANAHAVWRGLSGPLRAGVAHYHAGAPDELVLVLHNGVEVMFGRAERLDEKVRALGAVLEDVGDTGVRVIDVRAPRAPVVLGH